MEKLGMHKTLDLNSVRKDFEAEFDSTELDFEAEFYIVLRSAIERDLSSGFSYVSRTRRMVKIEKCNFFSLAAETVVACYRNRHGNLHKYYEIQDRLAKARIASDENSEKEIAALGEIEKLAEQIVDIFDY